MHNLEATNSGVTSEAVFTLAEELRKAKGGRRDNRPDFFEPWDFFAEARRQLENGLHENRLTKRSKPATVDDDDLRKRAAAAELRRALPGVGDVDRRIVVGEVETKDHGRLFLEVDHGASVIRLHDVNVSADDLDADLCGMLFSTAASFNAAQVDAEQSNQRALLGLVVTAVLERHKWLEAKVRERADHLRLTAV